MIAALLRTLGLLGARFFGFPRATLWGGIAVFSRFGVSRGQAEPASHTLFWVCLRFSNNEMASSIVATITALAGIFGRLARLLGAALLASSVVSRLGSSRAYLVILPNRALQGSRRGGDGANPLVVAMAIVTRFAALGTLALLAAPTA